MCALRMFFASSSLCAGCIKTVSALLAQSWPWSIEVLDAAKTYQQRGPNVRVEILQRLDGRLAHLLRRVLQKPHRLRVRNSVSVLDPRHSQLQTPDATSVRTSSSASFCLVLTRSWASRQRHSASNACAPRRTSKHKQQQAWVR